MKKTLIYLGLSFLALVAVALIGNSIWIARVEARLEEKLSAIRAAGDPVTLPEIAHTDPPPATDTSARPANDNAAVYLERARKDVAAMAKELNALGEGEDYRAGKLSDADHEKLKSLIEAYPEAFKLLDEAGACSKYNPSIDYTAAPDAVMSPVLDHASGFRRVLAVLEARARLQLADAKRHEALQTGLLIFRLSRLRDGNGLLIDAFVTCAGRAVAVEVCNRALRAGAMETKDRDALDRELDRHDGLDGLARALKCERAFGISSYEDLKPWLLRGIRTNDECHYLDLVQEQIDLTRKSYSESVKAAKNFSAANWSSAPLAALWFPAAQKTREAYERTRGVTRCLRVLNALQRAGVKPADGEPKLADLKLPAGATVDPFTGEPLHVKVVDGQWLIYTVGVNLTDDGGDLAGHKDFGVGPLAASASK